MLQDIVLKGSTDRSVTLRCLDSTTGAPKTDVVFNTAGINLWYRREGAALTSITEATLAALTTAHADGGFLHVSDGVYRLDLPDAAFASGANYVDFGGTVTGGHFVGGRVRLIDVSLEVANIAANMTQISGDSTAADNLEIAFDDTAGPVPWMGIVDQGTAQSASSTGVVLRSAAAFADDTLIGCTIGVLGSTQGYWQFREITDNALSGDAVTVDAWTVTPSGTITYKIFGGPPASATLVPPVNVTQFGGVAGTFSGGRPEVNTTLIEGSDATNQIRDAVVDDATRIDASALNTLSSHDPGETIMGATDLGTGAGLTSLASAANLATAAGYIDTEVSAIKAVTDKLDDTLEDSGGGAYIFTEASLAQAPSGTGASAQSIVEAMFQNDSGETAASAVPGSAIYEIVENAGGGSAPTASQIADEVQTRTIAAVTTVNGLAANVITAASTAADFITEVQNGLATASALATVDNVVDAIQAKTDALPSDPADQSLIIAATNALDSHLTTIEGKVDTVDNVADAILVDTAEIGAAGAGLTALASAVNLATVDSNVDAIKAKTDSLTFTTGRVHADTKAVAGVVLQQNGSGTQSIGGP